MSAEANGLKPSVKRMRTYIRKTATTVATIGLFSGMLPAWYQVRAAKRAFKAEDSIEISYIVNPVIPTLRVLRGGKYPVQAPLVSPDRKHFLLVTQRGLLPSNTTEATVWLFQVEDVREYVLKGLTRRPFPAAIATLRASSNTPVISEVRWLDVDRIAFLGKKDGPYQQLFIFNLKTGLLAAMTNGEIYVSNYDVSGDILAYTTLLQPKSSTIPRLIHLGGQTTGPAPSKLVSLLNPDPRKIEDINEGDLLDTPSTLHVLRNGQEIDTSFNAGTAPMKLFMPTLAISPDGKRLITVVPVHEFSAAWERYRPSVDDSNYLNVRLRPGNRWAVAEDNPFKAEQYVIVNLEDGQIDRKSVV